MSEWAAEFWLTLLLGALIVAVSLSLGIAVGYDRGRQRGIRDERARAERRSVIEQNLKRGPCR